ncbi:MAG: pantoate--beta-alanine ligase [Ardenticatenaceae bacterium]|nr:pantoate--beta-alanine ligase [Ardenticatenaceae bacterium]
MNVVKTIEAVRTMRWQNPSATWGLVPTMGYLHEGHISLVRQARAENDFVAATIYVNPTQFAPTEDLSSYPRDLTRDLALLEEAGADLVFTPNDALMYPHGFQSYVTVDEVTAVLEGASRPTHFRGVTTIVAKLFNIVQPTRAYFGQKDFQQTVVIRRMIADLNINLQMIVCPTVREADGLALSSRNTYLTPPQREAATVLSRALKHGLTLLNAGERSGDVLHQEMTAIITAESLAQLDYLSVAHPHTLAELAQVEDMALLSMAVFVGKTRLIDNMPWPSLTAVYGEA